MKQMIDAFVNNIVFFLSSCGPWAGILLIMMESILPVLPLSVFITLNMVSYGNLPGLLISWFSTMVGCTGSFFLCRSCFQKKAHQYLKKRNREQLTKWMKAMSDISLSNLVILIAVPFGPAFLINVVAGLSKVSYKKFAIALFIGKFFMVYFWGYVGTTLLDSLTDITILIKVGTMLGIAYLVSKIISKKFNVK